MKRRRRSSTAPYFLPPPSVPLLPAAPLAAAFAESTVALVLAPVDSWKSSAQLACSVAVNAATNDQTGRSISQLSSRANFFNWPSVLARQSFRPYRGALVSVAGAAVESLAFVAVYRFLRRVFTSVLPCRHIQRSPVYPSQSDLSHLRNQQSQLHSEKQPPLWAASVLAGAGASVFSILMSAPIDLVRERLRSGQFRSPLTALRAVASGPKSWKALYVGVIPTMVRDLPFDALEFAVFEAFERALCTARRRAAALRHSDSRQVSVAGLPLKSVATKGISIRPLSSFDHLALGMLTGAVVGAAVAPLDLVVTRILVNPARYSGLMASLRTIVREEGSRGLFAGAAQKVAREAFASGLFFTCYQGVLSKFGIVDDDRDDLDDI